MRVGLIVSDTWHFFEDIAIYLSQEFETKVFHETVYKLPFLGTKINNWRLRHDLSRLMTSVDIAFFEWASTYLVIASHLPKQCKIITRLHRYELFYWATQINWQNVDQVILVSTGMQRTFADRLPQHAHKTVVIPGGIRLDRFRPTNRRFVGDLGTLCCLEPRKRVYELILAFYSLVHAGYNFQLHIGGGEDHRWGDYYVSLRRLVEKLNLQDRVIFYGFVEDTPTWYHNIDIFISNSYAEGLQVAPMEAIASGCYALSHFWDGCEDIFTRECIFSTEEEMKARIISYCQAYEPERAVLREQQRAIIVERYDIHHVSRQIAQLISEVTT